MRVRLNGEEREVKNGTSIEGLMETMKIDRRHVVVEYNGNILQPSSWQDVCLADNDRLELLSFVGGG